MSGRADVEIRYWWLRLVLGVVALVLGVVVIAWPEATIRIVAALFGLNLLVDGFGRVFRAILAPEGSAGERAIFGVLGVAGFVLGAVCLLNLPETVAVLVLVTGLFWVLAGVTEVVVALVRRDAGWTLTLGVGVVSLLAGAVVLAYPRESLGVLVLLVGGSLIAHGVVSVVTALALRRSAGAARDLPPTGDRAPWRA